MQTKARAARTGLWDSTGSSGEARYHETNGARRLMRRACACRAITVFRINLEACMKGNLVIVCRDQDALAFDQLMVEYGAFQTRLSSTAWYLKLDATPELIQEEILARLGKYTTHYIFEAGSVTYNTVDNEAAAALDTLFSA
jgi:hypothetical protein